MRIYRFKTKSEFKAEFREILHERNDGSTPTDDCWQDYFDFDDDLNYQGRWFGKEISYVDYLHVIRDECVESEDLEMWEVCQKWSEKGAEILNKNNNYSFTHNTNAWCHVLDSHLTYDDLDEMKSHMGVRINMLVLYKKRAMPVDKIFKIKNKVYFATIMSDGSIKRFLPTTCKIIPKRIFNKVK